MTDFRKQAERVKLARLLHTSPESLGYLDGLDLSTLQTLRFSCRRFLLEEHRGLFRRVATAIRLLPAPLVAMLAERVLGPLLCARVADQLDTPRVMQLVRHLTPEFVASVAVYIETDQARELATTLPLSDVLNISRILVERGEYSLMGDLVGNLPLSLIEAMLRNIRDGEALLRIAFFVENTQRLSDILDVLPPHQVMSVIRAAADERTDLWPEALALISVVKPHWQRRLVSMAVDGDEATLISMVRGVVKHDLWSTALPLLELMTENHRRRVINLPVVHDEAVLRQLLHATSQRRLWKFLLPLVPLMEPPLRRLVTRLAEDLDDAEMEPLVKVFSSHQQWSAALQMMEHMSTARRQLLARHIADDPDSSLEKLATTVHEQQLWPLFFPLVAALPETAVARLISLPLYQEDRVLHDIVSAAHQHHLWPYILPFVQLLPERDRSRFAIAAENMSYAQTQQLVCSLDRAEHWAQALSLMSHMRQERRTAITLQVSDQHDGVLNHMLRSLQETASWKLLLDLITALPADAQHQLIVRSGNLDVRLRARLLVYADQHQLSDAVLVRMAEMPSTEVDPHRDVIPHLPEENLANLRHRCNELGLSPLLG
ncbi:MAG: hypothetical protein ACRERR_04290 [Moraxellaceae bacterium]